MPMYYDRLHTVYHAEKKTGRNILFFYLHVKPQYEKKKLCFFLLKGNDSIGRLLFSLEEKKKKSMLENDKKNRNKKKKVLYIVILINI